MAQYNTTYKQWWEFCNNNNVDYFTGDVSKVILFFNNLFKEKTILYGTFNSHRAALALILPGDIGSNLMLKRYFKGLCRLRPSKRKYHCIWNPDKVINLLSKFYPNEELSLENLSMKLVTLLALTTGQRMQTISLIKVENVVITENGIKILIPDSIKTTKHNTYQPYLNIPFFENKMEVCVSSVLYAYVERTVGIRGDIENLILTSRAPYRKATTQTISRWIKKCLSLAGINPSLFTAYSTRHASTSAAFHRGVSLDIIRKTAGWTEKSRTFAKFYNLPLDESNTFAGAILNSDQC